MASAGPRALGWRRTTIRQGGRVSTSGRAIVAACALGGRQRAVAMAAVEAHLEKWFVDIDGQRCTAWEM